MATQDILRDSNLQDELTNQTRLRQFVNSTPGLALFYFCAITFGLTSFPLATTLIPTPILSPKASPSATLPKLSPPTWSVPLSVEKSVSNLMVIDDGDLEFFRSGGDEFAFISGFGGDVVWTTTTNGDEEVQVEWRPVLSICGIYEVEVYIPSGINLTSSAFYQVGYRQGMVSRSIDQSAFYGTWVSLGEYELLPTSGSFLKLTNSTGETTRPDLAIVFDAARWKLISVCKTNQP